MDIYGTWDDCRRYLGSIRLSLPFHYRADFLRHMVLVYGYYTLSIGDGHLLGDWVSLFFGLAVILVGFVTDLKKKEDFAFWGYLFGTLSFWGGLNALVWTRGNIALFIYVVTNLILMVLSIVLMRKVLMVFGAIGLFSYLSYLSFNLFVDSVLFPFYMSLVGLAIICLGILYQKN